MYIKYRPLSFLMILIVYILAFVTGALCYAWAGGTPLFRTFISDMAATAIVFIFSLIFNNASVYDPYWSLAPMVILLSWVTIRGNVLSSFDVFLLAAVFFWGMRLTLNWASVFKGLRFQD